jgi:diguanylate cyclase (GGDEF)-like protein
VVGDDADLTQVVEMQNHRLQEFMLRVLPLFVFVFSILVTYHIWEHTTQVGLNEMETKFHARTTLIKSHIEQRMMAYEGVLSGLRGLFASSDSVNRNEFRTYVEMLHLEENFPGIQGVGYALKISPEKLLSHQVQVRQEGFSNYSIYPADKRAIYTSIIYLEPFVGRNLRAFGYDMYTDPARRSAMDSARDGAKASISGKVRLVQEDGNRDQAGFLMYLPVYENGFQHETVKERREHLAGWVYAPFRMDDLMSGLNEAKSDDVDLEIYDGDSSDVDNLMFDLDHSTFKQIESPPLFTSSTIIEIAGHKWTLLTRSRPEFEEREKDNTPTVLAWSGCGFSVFLALLTWLLVRDRARALNYASRMQYLSTFDQLTRLPNRVLFKDRFQLALANAKRNQNRFAVMFVDLDRFKPVNDTYGHAVGDLLLQGVADRLRSCLRESDTAARIGGDEFVVLLFTVQQEADAMRVAEKILQTLNEPFDVGGHHLNISASIGVAIYPGHGQNLDDLTRNADAAMYTVKKHGSGNIGICEGMLGPSHE